MNPLFAAHLIADFLLQPRALVMWKERTFSGIAFHALVHAAVMLVFMHSVQRDLVLLVLVIAILHGAIDGIKIHFQRRAQNFELLFFLDQMLHAAILIGAVMLFPFMPVFWKTEAGVGILLLSYFFSFSMAWWNLLRIEKFPLKNGSARLRRFLILILVFLAFIVPSQLLGASFCSGL